MYANVRGLKSKLPCVNDILADSKPSIVLLTETHLTENKGIKCEGYAFFGNAREGKSGGGVGILVANDMKAIVSPHYSQRDLEILWASIHRPGLPPVTVGVYYGKQESISLEDINEEFNSLTEEVLEKKASGEVILCMDANAKIGLMGESISRNGKLLIDMVDECELEIVNGNEVCEGVITRQNRKNETEASAIDFVLASYEASLWIKKMVIDEAGDYRIKSKNESDHNTILIDMMIEKIDFSQINTITEWNKKASPEKWEEFRRELEKQENEAWELMSKTDLSMTERYNKWEKLIYKAAMKTIGKTTFKIGGPLKQSQAMLKLKKEKIECKKSYETEENYDAKGEKLQLYIDKQNEMRELLDREEKERINKKFQKMINEGNNGFWGEIRFSNIDEAPNWMVSKGPDGKRILDPEMNKENMASYYEKLFKNNHVPSHPYHHEVIEQIEILSNQEGSREEEMDEIYRMPTEKEIEEAISKKKSKRQRPTGKIGYSKVAEFQWSD